MSPKYDETGGPYTARIPADVGTPDKIAFGLTFRQLGIIGAAGLAAWLLYRQLGHVLPPMVWLVLAVPAAAVTVVVALGRRDGLPLDVWLRHGLTLSRATKLHAPGHARPLSLAAVAGKPVVPAPLRPAATTISPAGALTADGVDRRLIACSTTNVGLRSGEEQAGLLDGFGRFLNALTAPAQIVVAARRHDLTPYAQKVIDETPRLADPALREAADDYATFLLELDATREPLRRQVLAVVAGDHAAAAAARTLSGLGVEATTLDGPAVTAALAAAVDPYQPPVSGRRAVPGTPITARRHP
jgi:hypothetical protein